MYTESLKTGPVSQSRGKQNARGGNQWVGK